MKYQKVFFLFFLLFLICLIYLFTFAQSVGYIQIKGDPEADVFLDNKPVGKTHPQSGNLILKDVPAGNHEVRIAKEGYYTQSIRIDLKANEVYLCEVSLKPKIGSLLIETIPVDCIIEIPQLGIDQENKGNKTKKYWEISVPIGKYTINFTASGKKVRYNLEVEEGVRKRLLVDILNNKVKEIQPVLTWDKTYGGSEDDSAFSLIQTTDGGYAVAGYTESKGAGKYDGWIIKLDSQGNMVWDKTYGGSEDEWLHSLIQTTDGGYAGAGFTSSKGSGIADFWIIKLDSQGNMVWDRTYGGSGLARANSLIQTTDGGYAVAGEDDAWLIKLDSQGNMVWDRNYGQGSFEWVYSLIQTTDGGYAVAGDDAWLIKLDSQGNIVWNRTYGGSGLDCAYSLIQTTDGGYAVAGSTSSKGSGTADLWLIKLDSQGNMVWDRTYGGNWNDWATSLIQTTDGGYAVAGYTRGSFNPSKGSGTQDLWVIKLDSQGNMVWDRTYGGSGLDCASSLIQTTDGGYAVAGFTSSKGAGKYDVWIIKLDDQGNLISSLEDLKIETEAKGTDNNFNITQTIPVPSFDYYQWEVGLPGFTKPGEKTYFKTPKPEVIQLLSPIDGATVSSGNITFSWNPVSNATKYQFVLYNSQGKIALDTTVNKTSIKVALGIEETITWKVRAGDSSGNWGDWSSTWSLTLKSTTVSNESSPQISETTYSLTGSLYCPDKRGYPCNSCSSASGYINHFKGFNVLTTNEDCYVKLVYQNGAYIGNKNNCEVTIKGEKWLGLEDQSGTLLTEEIKKGNFDFKPANLFTKTTMTFPQDGYQYEVFTYQFEKGIFPQAYAWPNGVANYGQCVWWAAKRWVEEVDSQNLFPFYPSSIKAANIEPIGSDYQPKECDVLIDYNPDKAIELGHYGFVEKVEDDKIYITQFNWIKPGEVYNYVEGKWREGATDLFYSNNPSNEYYFNYYYRK